MNILFIISFACVCLLACAEKSADTLETIKNTGTIVVLTTNQPTTYYLDQNENPSGPEYDMVESFATYLGVKTSYKVLSSTSEVIVALSNGEGHLAAAGLTKTPARESQFDFGPTLMNVSEELICHRKSASVDNIGTLENLEVVVASSTSYIETIKAQIPNMQLVIDDELRTPQLLEKVNAKKIQCTISDSTIYAISRRYHPDLISRYEFNKDLELAWMLPQMSVLLRQEIDTWLTEYKKRGDLSQLHDKYYSYLDTFDYVDIKTFKRRIESRLPKYKAMFIAAAKENNISASLLAAQSYQESHWDPKAKSPTGVRGIMMLTQPVAKSLGVTSRLDAQQNIFAGAKYFAKMKNMFDDQVNPLDRDWMALAAYNIGRGHFRDAQNLTTKQGGNAQRWLDIKETLPLLSDKKYYESLRYGYARGNEPVQYVQRIREYNDILIHEFNKP